MGLVGYVRSVVSGDGYEAEQRRELLAAGVPAGRIFADQATGRHDARPGLDACLRALKPGDTLVVCRLDRVGRDLRHVVAILHELTRGRIGLLIPGRLSIEPQSAEGEHALPLLAALADYDRALAMERTVAGLQRARARGRNGGRPFKLTPDKLLHAQAAMTQRDTKVTTLCEQLGITRQTLYRHLDPNGGLRPDGAKLLGQQAASAAAE
jgi:DNA invertase Pin-like site-specific DNA recombinase